MDLRRVQNQIEFVTLKEKLIPLFETYKKRIPYHEITVEEMYNNYLVHLIFADSFFFTIAKDDEVVGFIGGHLLRGPSYNIFYILDIYCPNGRNELKGMLKNIQDIVGSIELWGRATENIYRVYRYFLKNKGIEKVQFVRIKL